VDNLQKLCRALQAENKLLEETTKRNREDFFVTADVSIAADKDEATKLLAPSVACL
jgi:hypothetical protein